MKKAIAALEFNINICRACGVKSHDHSVWKDEIDQCARAIEALKAIEIEDERIAYEKEQCATAASESFNAMFDRPIDKLAALSVRL